MLWSHLFTPTLREVPAEARTISHQLLLRAGYMRPFAPGSFAYLFLGQRSLQKMQQILRQEMESAGAQEIALPLLQPGERHVDGTRMAMLAGGELRSYKQLPQLWHQFQPIQQHLVHSSCAFDVSPDAHEESLRRQWASYQNLVARCGVSFFSAGAHSSARRTRLLMAASNTGDDVAVLCRSTGYAATLATAAARPVPPVISDPEGHFAPEPFYTPDQKSIADIARFTGLPETSQIKSRVMVADGAPVLVLLRGDHQLSEEKLQIITGAAVVRPAIPAEMQEWFGASAGSLGPVNLVNPVPILADLALHGRRNLIAGANRDHYHLRHVTPDQDFHPSWHDLRLVTAADTSLDTGDPLEFVRAIEIGRLCSFEDHRSHALGLTVLDESGQELPVWMSSSSIIMERLLCAAVEQHHDTEGICLPPSIAPFDVVIAPVHFDNPAQRLAAESLYSDCKAAGLDPLFDDRNERPGVKFKDADLIGVPYRINVGRKLPQGIVEVSTRRTRQTEEVPVTSAVAFVQKAIRKEEQ